jgi:ubiquinone/menaquinone biosynthesis C-methylase UbiE
METEASAPNIASSLGIVRVSATVSLKPEEAFDEFVDELKTALRYRGMSLDSPSIDGKIMEGNTEVGIVREARLGERLSIVWRPKSWEKNVASQLTVTFSRNDNGTEIAVEQRGWDQVLGDGKKELLGWFTGEVVASLLLASAPGRLGDWVTDRNARRPSGERSRGVYSNPVYHWPNFFAILDVLKLGPSDYLLEVGCGGGAFLHEALKSGCRASAIDHSLDMVRLATQANRESVAGKRLKVEAGEADSLPYSDGSFTCAVMTGVLGFLPDALKAFQEVHRVLGKGGRFVVYTGSKVLKGTPAAPEPAASRIHFYEDEELESLARRAGFVVAEVDHRSLFEYAKKAGVPESDIGLFKGTNSSQLLIARKA